MKGTYTTQLGRCIDCGAILVSEPEVFDQSCQRCTRIAAAKLVAWLLGTWLVGGGIFIYLLMR